MSQTPPIEFGFRELEIFAKVVELQSFSKAADAVFLAQASVSGRIASLENKIGVKLLNRLGRKVVPTAAGELVYKHARLLLEMKKTARAEMERFLGLETGQVFIGGSTIPGEYILPAIIGKFNKIHPHLTVDLSIADSHAIENRIVAGKLEIGVIGRQSEKSLLSCRKLWQDELVLVLPSQHPLASRREVPIESVVKEPFIIRENGSGTLNILKKHLSQQQGMNLEDFNIRASFGSSTAVKEGIKAGVGISILSRRAVEADIQAGLLQAVGIKKFPLTRHFYLIRHKQRIPSPACQAINTYLLSSGTLAG